MLAVGHVDQLVAAFHVAGPHRKRLDDQELGDGEVDRAALPGAHVACRVEHQVAAHQRLDRDRVGIATRGTALAADFAAAQKRADALDQQALRERLLDIVVRPHAETQHLVDFLVLRGEEDHRHRRRLAEFEQHLHAVHARHLDVEHDEVRRLREDPREAFGAVVVHHHLEALRFESHRNRGENIPVVVHQCNRIGHGSDLPHTGPKCRVSVACDCGENRAPLPQSGKAHSARADPLHRHRHDDVPGEGERQPQGVRLPLHQGRAQPDQHDMVPTRSERRLPTRRD